MLMVEVPAPWLVVHVADYIPPIRLSILIGECVHNMRSAVDNLVCGLALTLKSTSKCRDLAFAHTAPPLSRVRRVRVA
jgi:hypothetical protein